MGVRKNELKNVLGAPTEYGPNFLKTERFLTRQKPIESSRQGESICVIFIIFMVLDHIVVVGF